MRQAGENLRAEAFKELRDIPGRSAELNGRGVAAEDQLRRVEVRAPRAGIVHRPAVHMVGGMISPAEPAMPMAPVRMRSISGPAPPPEIDEALIGQRAVVRLRAFNQPTTPELQATVSRIGAEVIREPQKSLTCDTIRLVLPASKIARIAPLAIVSGMKADVYFETYARSPWARLPRPVKDQFLKAFQER